MPLTIDEARKKLGLPPLEGGPAPKATPKPYDPLGMRQHTAPRGTVMPTAQQLRQQQSLEAGASQVMGYGNTLGILVGAAARDAQAGVNPFGELSTLPITGKKPAKTNVGKAFNMLNLGQSQEAGDEYFLTSRKNLQALAKGGDVHAQWLVQHE